MNFDIPILRNGNIKKVVPLAFFLIILYVDFVSFYSVAYQEIFKTSKGIAICLWCLISVLQVLVLCYWILIFIIGSGKAPHIKPFNIYDTGSDSKAPDYFECDANGYPYYCSTCQSIKPLRSFHLKDMESCILKFDHYCVWIGTAIGEANYLVFLKFLFYLISQHITHLVFAACYIRRNIRHGSLNLNFVALFVISALIIVMVLALLVTNLRYVALNRTTLDDITRGQARKYHAWKLRNEGKKVKSRHVPRKEKGFRFINIKYNNSRAVIKHGIQYDNYNLGVRKNIINLVYNFNRSSSVVVNNTTYSNEVLLRCIFYIMLPLYEISYSFKNGTNTNINKDISDESYNTYEFHSPLLSEQFTSFINSKVESGEYTIPSYLTQNEDGDNNTLHRESNPDEKDLGSNTSSDIV